MEQHKDERRTVTVEEAARAVGISLAHYYKQVAAGTVPGLRVGAKRIVVPRDQLEQFLAGTWQPRSAS